MRKLPVEDTMSLLIFVGFYVCVQAVANLLRIIFTSVVSNHRGLEMINATLKT